MSEEKKEEKVVERLVARCPECGLKLRGCYTAYADLEKKNPERIIRHEEGIHHQMKLGKLKLGGY